MNILMIICYFFYAVFTVGFLLNIPKYSTSNILFAVTFALSFFCFSFWFFKNKTYKSRKVKKPSVMVEEQIYVPKIETISDKPSYEKFYSPEILELKRTAESEVWHRHNMQKQGRCNVLLENDLSANEHAFFNDVLVALKESGFNPGMLDVDRLSTGTYNVTYDGIHLGKIKLTGRKYYMHYLVARTKIVGMHEPSLQECIDTIPRWIRYIRYCKRNPY